MLKSCELAVLLEDVNNLESETKAKQLAQDLGLKLHKVPLAGSVKKFSSAKWQLVISEEGLSLRLSSEPKWSDIFIDFKSAALQYRKQHGGGKNEAIARAIGIKTNKHPRVIDCTAGMGTDSFIMASVGARVLMLERSAIISKLLIDALQRAHNAQVECEKHMHVVNFDSGDFLSIFAHKTWRDVLSIQEAQKLDDFLLASNWYESEGSLTTKAKENKFQADVLYLDPMFPHKKKSALVKKEMQAFQQLLGPDLDSERLMDAALEFPAKRVVVKRPANAPELSNALGVKPIGNIPSKKHRFDIYQKP